MSTILEDDATNGVVYRIMTVDDTKTATLAIARAFFEGAEPVTVTGGGATLRDMEAFCRIFVPRMAAEGNAVLAVDSATDEIIGAFLNEDFANTDPPELESFSADTDGIWGPCLTMIEDLEVILCQKFTCPAPRATGRFFHLWMLGVGSAGRGRGVGKKLAAHSVAWAKARGFQIAFAETTGSISTHILSKLGAQRLAFCDYATWQGEQAETLRGLPALGHLGMSMMVIELNGPSDALDDASLESDKAQS